LLPGAGKERNDEQDTIEQSLQEFGQTIMALLSRTTPVDWAVAAWLLWCVVRGASQGLGAELGRIMVATLAILGGIPLFHWLLGKVRESQSGLDNTAAGDLLCFAITFFLIAILARVVHLLVRKGVEKILTGWFSHVVGGVGGLVRGGIIYGVVLLMINASSVTFLKQAALEHSWFGSRAEPHLAKPYAWLSARVPILPDLVPDGESPALPVDPIKIERETSQATEEYFDPEPPPPMVAPRELPDGRRSGEF